MLLVLKNLIFKGLFNFSLFFMLLVGIQNSSSKNKVDFIIGKTVSLPVSFIIGVSFIGGSMTGGILNINLDRKNNKIL